MLNKNVSIYWFSETWLDGIETNKFIELIGKWKNEEFVEYKRLILLFMLLISFIFIVFSLYKLRL